MGWGGTALRTEVGTFLELETESDAVASALVLVALKLYFGFRALISS